MIVACRLYGWTRRHAVPPVAGIAGYLMGSFFPSHRLPPAPRSILVLKPCCLGDVLMATPAVAALRRHYPRAHLAFAVGRHARRMVEGNPHIDEIVDCGRVGDGSPPSPREYLALARALRARRFDLCFVLDRGPLLTLLPWLAGVPHRVGLDSGGRGFSLTIKVRPQPDRHEVEVYLDILREVGINPGLPGLEFYPTAEERAWATNALPRQPGARWVALHAAGGDNPGMSLHAKRWWPERFAALGDLLLARGARLVLVGSPAEQPVSALVLSLLATPEDREPGKVLDLTGQTSIGSLAALLERCQLYVGNDAGPTHLAAAMGTPAIAIFGPSDSTLYAPYSPVGVALHHRPYCSPCLRHGIYRFVPNCVLQCLAGTTPSAVLAAAEQLVPELRGTAGTS